MKDLPLGFALVLMGSDKFRWQSMNREEFWSSRLGHSFPSNAWIKSHLKQADIIMNPQYGKEVKWEGLILIFKFIYDFEKKIEGGNQCFISPVFIQICHFKI